MKQLSLAFPLNSTSLGQTSLAILREMFSRGYTPAIFPIGGVDISSQANLSSEFHSWLQHCINTAPLRYSRKAPSIRLWHTQGSCEHLSSTDSRLLTFVETDQITNYESNILKQFDKIYITSKYTQKVFSEFGVNSTHLPLGFDSANFHQLEKDPKIKGELSFLIAGKLEKRKGHFKVLDAWAKKYGNKHGYKLNVACHNHFLGRTLEESAANTWAKVIHEGLGGKEYWNIRPVPFCPTNAQYNSVLQSSHIYIGMSGGEGFDLPCYHAVAMGAHVVALRAHAYNDYLNDDNAVLVTPSAKIPVYDGVFFAPGAPFSQGNIFDWDEEPFYEALDKVETAAKKGPNHNGLTLQKTTYKDTVDILLNDLL